MKNPLPPSLVAQWHPVLNEGLLASEASSGSAKKAWWLGDCGHAWEAAPKTRLKGNGCPFCSNRAVLAGFNDLATTQPEIAAQWHPTKNGDLTPQDVTEGSKVVVWWVDEHGHEWDVQVKLRRQFGCPICSGKRILPGFNDLATKNPALAAEWHLDKNAHLDLATISPYSHEKVWWLGECGHEWSSELRSRFAGKGCPFCKNKRVKSTFNDLATTHPDVAAQWHPTKNGDVQPTDVVAGSIKRVWWLCPQGHEWYTSTKTRVYDVECSFCKASSVLRLEKNKAFQEDTASDMKWHPRKNGSSIQSDYSKTSKAIVWWICGLGHEWQAEVKSFERSGKCPVCSGRKIALGHTDLSSTHPRLVEEIDLNRNQDLDLTKISRGSEKRIVWNCEYGHQWEAVVYSRTDKRSVGCPECAVLKHNFVSKPELELFEFLTKLGFAVEQSNRKVLGNRQEIDLFIPENQFGIEFNGLYWHSESAGKGRNYHKDKYDAAKAAGVQLLQIWEDDWRDRKPVILRALAHKLGVTSRLAELYPELNVVTSKVFARKTSVAVLSTEDAKLFLGLNHVQGFASGSYYLGLKDADGVVKALMVLKKEAGETLNIVRYATAGSVTGGFTKLLKHATKTYLPSSFITFADHTISDGGLYESHGFETDRVLSPDYMYVVGGERKHKFGYRLKRFKNDDSLVWQEGLTERELALLNNLPRIWDAGKTRYRLTV
jgi:G:T-mismatch repair DNA endonuclease (very short patch repair protein)